MTVVVPGKNNKKSADNLCTFKKYAKMKMATHCTPCYKILNGNLLPVPHNV
jgi:hypothetical protein